MWLKSIFFLLLTSILISDFAAAQQIPAKKDSTHLYKNIETFSKKGKFTRFMYMNQEGRGIGLINKLKAYHLQDIGMDTVEANIALGFKPDERDYGIGAQILRDLNANKIRLITNNYTKKVGLSAFGLEIIETIPIRIKPNKFNLRYLKTKQDKLGHTLNID